MSEHFASKLLTLIVLVAGVVSAQSVPPAPAQTPPRPAQSARPAFAPSAPYRSASPRKDIPAIARTANGAIVSIIMSNKDGHAVAQGSGFFISKDGRIVTNYHVIENGSSAIVKLPDGAFYVVDGVLAFDKARDVAVIKAHGENFRTLALGNSDRLQVGEEVVAIGNPLSLESTVSNGIVSGIRTAEEESGKFLQVTTPISPGSSGGPLFNMAGEVVGITTLYIKGGENLNFAIPINDVKPITQSLSLKTVSSFPDEKPEETDAKKPEKKPAEKPTDTANFPPNYRDFLDLYRAGGVNEVFDRVCLSLDGRRFFLMTIRELQAGFLHILFYKDGVQDRSTTSRWNTKTDAWESEKSSDQTYVDNNDQIVTKTFYELKVEPATKRFRILDRVTTIAYSYGKPGYAVDDTQDIGYEGSCFDIPGRGGAPEQSAAAPATISDAAPATKADAEREGFGIIKSSDVNVFCGRHPGATVLVNGVTNTFPWKCQN